MRWPWISRRWLEQTIAQMNTLRMEQGHAQLAHDKELDRLQLAHDKAVDHLTLAYRHEADRLVNEIAFLREQNLALLGHLRRVDRARVGLTETEREPRAALEPMPEALDAYYDKLDNKALAQELRRQAYRLRGQGTSWEKIVADVLPPPPEPEPEPEAAAP